MKKDAYGVTFEVPLADGATSLSYILHKGDEKDLPTDQSLDLAANGHEVWLLAGQPRPVLPQTGGAPDLDLTKSEAQWIDRDTVALPADGTAALSAQLVYDRDGGITVKDGALSGEGQWLRLNKAAGGLTDAQLARVPAAEEVRRLHRRPPRPRPGRRRPREPAGPHPAHRQRRARHGDRRTDSGSARRPVRAEGRQGVTRAGLHQERCHPVRLGADRPVRRPRPRRTALSPCDATTRPASGR